MRGNTIALVVVMVAVGVLALYGSIIAGVRLDTIKELEQQNKELVVQNVQNKEQAYRDGILACQEEDINVLNALADESTNSTLSNIFLKLAGMWSYDQSTLDAMVEAYMKGDTTYE